MAKKTTDSILESPAVKRFLVNSKDYPEMAKNIGKQCWFKQNTPKSKSYGLIHLELHKIIAVQKDYKGDICYRVQLADNEQDAGRVAEESELVILSPFIMPVDMDKLYEFKYRLQVTTNYIVSRLAAEFNDEEIEAIAEDIANGSIKQLDIVCFIADWVLLGIHNKDWTVDEWFETVIDTYKGGRNGNK